jgi:CBS domain containing-hemolysin-like protein
MKQQSGEHFEWSGLCFEVSGLCFEVMGMDGTRVDKILVTPLAPENTTPENYPD